MAGSKKVSGKKAELEEPRAGAGKVEVLKKPVPEWANSAAIGELIGVGMRRVQQLTQDGVLETEVPPGGGLRQYRTCATIKRYIAHVKETARGSKDKGEAGDLAIQKLKAEVKLKESQGQLAAIKADIAEGRYIETAAATEQLTEFMIKFKSFAMNIPSRISGIVAGYTDGATARAIERAAQKEIEDMLSLFAAAAVVSTAGSGNT